MLNSEWAYKKCLHTQLALKWIIRFTTVLSLFVLSNNSFACDESNTINADESDTTYIQQVNAINTDAPHTSHENCYAECCEKGCNCKLSASLWLLLLNETSLPSAPHNYYLPFQSLYSFIPPSVLHRPPISA